MKNSYYLDSLANLVNSEQEQLEDLGLKPTSVRPSELTIQTILGFSKQLSIRKSTTLGTYEQNCN